MHEESSKNQSIIDWWCGKWVLIQTNVECFGCSEVEALGYFHLLDMRYGDRNVVTERVNTIFLQPF